MDTLRPREFDEIAALEQPSIVASMWRYRWLVALIVAVFIGLGLAFQAYVPSVFQATAEMVVEDPRSSQLFNVGDIRSSGQNPQRYVADQVEILQSPRVAFQAAETRPGWASTDPETLGDADWPVWLAGAELLADVSIIAGRVPQVNSVSPRAGTATSSRCRSRPTRPTLARIGANTIVEAYQDVRFEQLEQHGRFRRRTDQLVRKRTEDKPRRDPRSRSTTSSPR